MEIAVFVFAVMLLTGVSFAEIISSSVFVVVALIAAVLFIRQFVRAVKKYRRLREKEYEDDFEEDADEPDPAPDPEWPPVFKKYNGAGYLVYQYNDVYFSLATADIPFSMLHKPIEFFRDIDGISIRCEQRKIGTLNPHKITDMISDWLDREDSYSAFFASRKYDTMEGTFIIAFYRDELAYAYRRYDEHREFKLTGNRSGEIAEMAAFTNEGERCTVDYDPTYGKHAVYDDHSNIIGFLPSPGVKYYEDHDDECVSVVSRVEHDEIDAHAIVYVTLFAKSV